jgi:hypothetical protein
VVCRLGQVRVVHRGTVTRDSVNLILVEFVFSFWENFSRQKAQPRTVEISAGENCRWRQSAFHIRIASEVVHLRAVTRGRN